METLNDLNIKLDTFNKFLNLLFKLGVASGSAILLFYCSRISYFPQDVTIGDSLLLIFLTLTFGFFYLFFVMCLTCLGLSLRPIWHTAQHLLLLLLKGYTYFTKQTIPYSPFKIEKLGIELFILPFIGLLFVYIFTLSDIDNLIPLVLSIFGCAYLWSVYQQNSRKIDLLESIILDPIEHDSKKTTNMKDFQPFILLAILLVPILVGGIASLSIDGTMRLAHLRADSTTVHIKKPYVIYASEYGLKGRSSNFGDEYSEYGPITVLFKGFGGNVVIDATPKSDANKIIPLIIPADHVFIVPVQN